jgi:pimeloyl-ACP methyl ester carboxylesterase
VLADEVDQRFTQAEDRHTLRSIVVERQAELDGQPVFWREAPGARVLYVHGVPTSSAMWVPFLERTGGIALDLPGFGRSTKRGDFPFTIEGYGAFLDRFAELVGLEGFRVCVHGWGALALAWAARRADSVERLAIIDAVPLLPGHRWHRIARAWRTPVVGEVAVGLTTRPVLRRVLPRELADGAAADFDQGTQRAILQLYRGADPEVLARAGARLGELRAPALIAWGERDPYVPARFAGAYADALGGPAEVLALREAGHWPWHDRPELVATVADFLVG